MPPPRDTRSPSTSLRDPRLAALPRGPHSLTREQVSANQRARIETAMLEAVGENGYGATTVSEIVARAGVSRKAFYEHYASKEQCFLSAYEEIVKDGQRRFASAFEDANSGANQMECAIGALFDMATENPHAMRLATTEIAALGISGIARRERAVLEYGELIQGSLRARGHPSSDGDGSLPETVLRAIVGGLNRVIASHLRRGRRNAPRTLLPDLARWIDTYHPVPQALHAARVANGSKSPRPERLGGRAPGTLSPRPASDGERGAARRRGGVSHSFVVHSQRERILDAIANLTAANGYIGLTVEDIASAGAVSLQAFYANFESKEDAFLVAYELGHTRGLDIVERATSTARDWRTGVRDGLCALTEYLASEPAFARMSLLGTLVATPRSMELSARGLASYARLLAPGLDEVPAQSRPPPIAVDAAAGGLHELFLHYAAQERTDDLPDLVVDATYVALAPFIGAEEAARVATGGSQSTAAG